MEIEVNGCTWNVQVDGDPDKEALLLLHGFTGNLQTWDPFVVKWSESYRLVRVDIIGHGKSAKPQNLQPYSMEAAVESLKTILNQLGIERTHVLGYSMGGRLALSFAMLCQDRVHSLILESSSPGLQTEEERKQRMTQDEKLAASILENGIPAFVDDWERLTLFASQQRLPEPVRTAIRKQRLQNDPIGLAGSLRGMGTGSQPSWWQQLSSCIVPTLLIVGKLDHKYCAIAQEMKGFMPECTKIVFDDSGHTPHVEQPQIFGTIVLDYLQSSRRRNT